MGYSYAQLEGFWINAGGNPAVAPIMAAIAYPESGGDNVKQQGQPYGTTGWGIWQITPGNSEPQCGTDGQLLNPAVNACAAVAKYNSQGLGAWTTYTSGAYRSHLQSGVNPDLSVSSKTADPGGGGGAAGTGGATSAGACGGGLLAGKTCALPFPLSINLPFGFNIGGCLLSGCQVKAIEGAFALVAGAAFFAFGVVMIAGYAYDNSGAKQAVNKTAKRIGVGTALLTGQPEIAAGLAATGGKGKGKSSSRTRSSSTMGRRESRSYERMYRDMMAENGDRTKTGAPGPEMRRRAAGSSTRSVSDEGQSAAAVRTRQRQQRERRQRRSVHYNEEGVGF